MDDVSLSEKQKEMLKEIKLCNQDVVIEDDDEFMISLIKWHGRTIIPKIISETRGCLSLNYEDYLNKCKVDVANNLSNLFSLEPFIDAMEEISNNEIILYRHKLEETLQNGLQSLIQIQFLDSLVILRRLELIDKLKFNHDSLENITFLMDNLVKFHNLKLLTVANEYYEDEKESLIKEFNDDLSYSSPESITQTQMNLKLKALSIALRQQHQCKMERDPNTLSNLYNLF